MFAIYSKYQNKTRDSLEPGLVNTAADSDTEDSEVSVDQCTYIYINNMYHSYRLLIIYSWIWLLCVRS
jgi:hypothetical protein